MASSTTTEFIIEDVSPLIAYDDKWSAGNKVSDPLANRYQTNSTFTLSTASGAAATFIFNGTSVSILGAKRSNHGPFSVKLDGKVTSSDGFGDNLFQTPLFQQNNLSETSVHTLVITNLRSDDAKPFLDIDFIKWSTTTQGDGSQLILEDTAFTYSPDAAWSSSISGLPGYSGNTGHFTTSRSAKATLSFKGDAVQLIGSVGPDHGAMTVELNGNKQSLNLQKTNYQAQTVLFHQSGLGAGNHTLVITPSLTGGNGLIAIDQAKIWNYNGPDASSGLATGAIIGIAVGAVVVVAILCVVGFLFWRKKKRRGKDEMNVPVSAMTIDTFAPPPQTAQTAGYSVYSRPAPSEYSSHSMPSQSYQFNTVPPEAQSQYGTYLPNPHSDSGSSSARLAYDQASTYGGQSQYSGGASTYGGYGRQSSRGGASSRGHAPHSSMSSSSAGPISPDTSQNYMAMPMPTSSYASQGQVTYPPEKGRGGQVVGQSTSRPSDRMQVAGREQDGGPAPAHLLPPAYEQATEHS
ncbi:hypothetical protein DL96DRAFT_819220 [Flagelloscypha sp. PMI_526]|nr:hypothetical protein DL96DRAFT_819220 [Flagelloscypha sp. PMI_526]